MSVKKILSKDDVRLKVNMKDILGRDLPGDEDILDAIAQKAMDLIIERTKGGKDVSGKPFKAYAKSYLKSDAFAAFGKSKSVDLTLSGDMLGLMEVVNTTKNTFELGWSDSTENAKAYNHNVGDTLPKREFLGLQKQELKELREFAEGLIKDGEG